MATKRLVAAETFSDEFFISLDYMEKVLWLGLIIKVADDQGRFQDNMALIRSSVFPADDIPANKIAKMIDGFVEKGRLYRYQKDDKKLLQLVNWWKHQNHQFPVKSIFPPPDHWTDRYKFKKSDKSTEGMNWEDAGGFDPLFDYQTGIHSVLQSDPQSEVQSDNQSAPPMNDRQPIKADDEYEKEFVFENEHELETIGDSKKPESRDGQNDIPFPEEVRVDDNHNAPPRQVKADKRKPKAKKDPDGEEKPVDERKFLGKNREAGLVFHECTGIKPVGSEYGLWNKGLKELAEVGITVEDIPRIVAEMKSRRLTIGSPGSLLKIGREMKEGGLLVPPKPAEPKYDYEPYKDENGNNRLKRILIP